MFLEDIITLHLLTSAWGTRIATLTGLMMSEIHNASIADLALVLSPASLAGRLSPMELDDLVHI